MQYYEIRRPTTPLFINIDATTILFATHASCRVFSTQFSPYNLVQTTQTYLDYRVS